MSTSPTAAQLGVEKKPLASSILLWVRTDQPRQTGMDYWKFPHSGIISATPGLEEYRQIHLAEHNPGQWPTTDGVQTTIPADRKIDGVAEVSFQSALSPLKGRGQTKPAFADEINVFRRTLLYAGPPNSSHWYDVADTEQPTGARTLIYLRRRDGVGGGEFRKFVNEQLPLALADAAALTELRTQTYLPWSEKLWATPNVAHDNPKDQHFHASLTLGFTDSAAQDAFFTSEAIENLSDQLAPLASAIHAYDVAAALTFVKNGEILPQYQE
ncbi:strictosidine synthase [Streptomyces sp. SAS_276]|uniref:strictosidine synthase n=1 Tax=Streptomyces sp. SAS_276 TaxID=3412745 RepID=UPI00403CB096